MVAVMAGILVATMASFSVLSWVALMGVDMAKKMIARLVLMMFAYLAASLVAKMGALRIWKSAEKSDGLSVLR